MTQLCVLQEIEEGWIDVDSSNHPVPQPDSENVVERLKDYIVTYCKKKKKFLNTKNRLNEDYENENRVEKQIHGIFSFFLSFFLSFVLSRGFLRTKHQV